MGRRKKRPCRNCSEMANRIAEVILERFRLRFADEKRNYWGGTSLIPQIVAELIDQVLEEEYERTEKESGGSKAGNEGAK
jgi:hypothetical protein